MIWNYGQVWPDNLPPADDTFSDWPREKFHAFREALGFGSDWRIVGAIRTPGWHQQEFTRSWHFLEEPNHVLDHTPDVVRWHRDHPMRGYGEPEREYYLAVWSTNGPTEFRTAHGEYHGKPGDLVVCNNKRVWHRVGREGLNFSTRYFMRMAIPRDIWTPAIDKLVVGD